MFKKITGILILLSFLLVKGVPLFAADLHQSATIVLNNHQSADDQVPDAEKENKQLEVIDEDFPDQPVLELAGLILPKKSGFILVPDITAPYISLPYPPPNSCS